MRFSVANTLVRSGMIVREWILGNCLGREGQNGCMGTPVLFNVPIELPGVILMWPKKSEQV